MTPATANSTLNILEAARSISAELRAHADYGERAGRLPEASIEALRTSGMLSLWRPKSLGGLECDPVTYAHAVEEIATADTAAAWLMHGTPSTWFDLRHGSEAFIEEVVASADVPVLAETLNRPMQATAAEGGYRITGMTPFASGCKFADWIGHTAFEGERFLLVYHPRGVLEIKEDWDSLGLRGTASNTIVANDVFVPDHRVIEVGDSGSLNPHFGGALYRFPPLIIPCAISAAILGTLRVSLEALKELAEKKTPFGSSNALKHRTLAQHHYGEALGIYRAARTYLHSTLREAFDCVSKGGTLDLRGRADLVLAYTFVQQRCLEAVRLVARAAGTTGIFKEHPLERAVRDAEVISHHVFGAESRYANVAQAYWGVEVDFPLLAME